MTGHQPPFSGESPEQETMGWGFDGAQRFQTTLGLRLTPAERLAWLERTLTEMRELCGLAREGRPTESDRRADEGAQRALDSADPER